MEAESLSWAFFRLLCCADMQAGGALAAAHLATSLPPVLSSLADLAVLLGKHLGDSQKPPEAPHADGSRSAGTQRAG